MCSGEMRSKGEVDYKCLEISGLLVGGGVSKEVRDELLGAFNALLWVSRAMEGPMRSLIREAEGMRYGG